MFVGRKKEIETISELIKRQKSVLITGKEGSGKTTLIKELSIVTKGCYFELTTPKDMLNKISAFLMLNKGVVTANVLLEKVSERITKRNETVLLIDNA